MKIKKAPSQIVFDILAYTLLTVASILCVAPFIMILSGSFTDNQTIIKEGYSFFPKNFSLDAYKTIFKSSEGILTAYRNTILYTFVGTTAGLLMITMTAYVLSRREFKYRNIVSFLIYFTTIFGGGTIPWYLIYANVLNLKGTAFVMIFPGLMSSYLVILMRTFIQESIPDAIIESAKIDGAGQITIFTRIVLPMLKPGLATIGLFLALGYWNDWYRSSMLATDQTQWELQFYLYNMLNASNAVKTMAENGGMAMVEVPTQSVKLAMAVVATGPVLLFYPFVQKYFVSGITVGAVKG